MTDKSELQAPPPFLLSELRVLHPRNTDQMVNDDGIKGYVSRGAVLYLRSQCFAAKDVC